VGEKEEARTVTNEGTKSLGVSTNKKPRKKKWRLMRGPEESNMIKETKTRKTIKHEFDKQQKGEEGKSSSEVKMKFKTLDRDAWGQV